MGNPEYMTLTEAGNYLNVNKSYLNRLCNYGKLAGAIKEANIWYVPIVSLDSYQLRVAIKRTQCAKRNNPLNNKLGLFTAS